jgi:heme oxygenase
MFYLSLNNLIDNKKEIQSSDNDDTVINDLNKIIKNSNYVLSISNLQVLLKDIDHLLENNNLNSDYLEDNNSLEINLQSKYF